MTCDKWYSYIISRKNILKWFLSVMTLWNIELSYKEIKSSCFQLLPSCSFKTTHCFFFSSCLFSSVIFWWPYPVFSGQALDLLVSVSSIRYRTSTSDLSTSSSSRGLTSFCYGISHLEGGFTLRCLQRLSRPDLATLPWSWSPTGTPAVSPSRSSRTKDSSSQISCAHAG